MLNKPTLILGASANAERYCYKATVALKKHQHTVYPVGIRAGNIEDTQIITDKIIPNDLHTVTLYIGPSNQKEWYDYILKLKPQRIVFNPGTENSELMDLAQQNGIECLEACTLVMLSIGNY